MEQQRKTIALIAHDHKKADIVQFCKENKEVLAQYDLCGTGTTAMQIRKETGLIVKPYLSGPLGGDLQIGAKIAEGKIDIVIFFWNLNHTIQISKPCFVSLSFMIFLLQQITQRLNTLFIQNYWVRYI